MPAPMSIHPQARGRCNEFKKVSFASIAALNSTLPRYPPTNPPMPPATRPGPSRFRSCFHWGFAIPATMFKPAPIAPPTRAAVSDTPRASFALIRNSAASQPKKAAQPPMIAL